MENSSEMDSDAIIMAEVTAANIDKRDFSFSIKRKNDLVEEYGVDKVVNSLISAIRKTGTEVIDSIIDTTKFNASKSKVMREIDRLQRDIIWGFKKSGEIISVQDSFVLVPSPATLPISTLINGHARYTTKISASASSPYTRRQLEQ